MNYEVTAFDLKLALLDYFRFERQWVCIDEFRHGDVVADTGEYIIEVETKISKGDLVNKEGYKTRKHHSYGIGHPFRQLWPNKFYFCVPESLVKSAMEMCLKLNPKYGIIAFNQHVFERQILQKYMCPHRKCLRIARTAKKLHEHYAIHQHAIAMRTSAKVVSLMETDFQNKLHNFIGA